MNLILCNLESQVIKHKRRTSNMFNQFMIDFENGPIRSGEVIVGTIRSPHKDTMVLSIHPVRACSDTKDYIDHIVYGKHGNKISNWVIDVFNNNVISRVARENMLLIYQEENNPFKQLIPKEWLLRWL